MMFSCEACFGLGPLIIIKNTNNFNINELIDFGL